MLDKSRTVTIRYDSEHEGELLYLAGHRGSIPVWRSLTCWRGGKCWYDCAALASETKEDGDVKIVCKALPSIENSWQVIGMIHKDVIAPEPVDRSIITHVED